MSAFILYVRVPEKSIDVKVSFRAQLNQGFWDVDISERKVNNIIHGLKFTQL